MAPGRNLVIASAAAPLAVVLTAATPALGGARALSWHVVKTFAAHNTFLNDIVGLRGGQAWAGGSSSALTPVLYHLSGRTWHAVNLPGSPGTFVASLRATSPPTCGPRSATSRWSSS